MERKQRQIDRKAQKEQKGTESAERHRKSRKAQKAQKGTERHRKSRKAQKAQKGAEREIPQGLIEILRNLYISNIFEL